MNIEINTETIANEEFMPIAFIGTMFIARNVIIAAIVVTPEKITGQAVSAIASMAACLRS